jgi:release factor glutamine methyltransferase
VQADLAAGLRPRAFALVVSNPPYVPVSEIDRLEPDVSRHEPRGALDGGPDGLEVIGRLVPQAGRLLRPGGWLALELGPGQWERVRTMALECGCFDMETAECVTDPAGCDRVFCIRKRAG